MPVRGQMRIDNGDSGVPATLADRSANSPKEAASSYVGEGAPGIQEGRLPETRLSDLSQRFPGYVNPCVRSLDRAYLLSFCDDRG
jgi:hypothetical protein